LGVLGTGVNGYKEVKKLTKSIGKIGNKAGKALRIGGPVFTMTSVYFSRIAYYRGEISHGEYTSDIAIALYSFIPHIGTAAAIEYTAIDFLHPSGIEGFSRDYASYYSNYVDKVGYFPRY